MRILICLLPPLLVFLCFHLTGKAVGLLWTPARHAATMAGGVAASLTFLAFLYGSTYGLLRLEVHRQTIRLDRLPAAFRGYRIVHLSDWHLGTFADDLGPVRRVVDSVNALQPDLIVFTGDIVNSRSDELQPFLAELSRLHAPDGVYAVQGNHDYCTYRRRSTPQEQARDAAEVVRLERQCGFRVLQNEHHLIHRGGDTLALVGTEHIGKPPFPRKGKLQKALQALPPHLCTVLLSHDPSHWRMEVLPHTDIDLTLSGHTHAIQLQVGQWSPVQWLYPEWGGLYSEQGRHLYVSTGIGGVAPFRLGAWPSFSLLELQPASAPPHIRE